MVECIRDGFRAYELFVNKEIHYIYEKDNTYKKVIFKAKRNDFMHLCGVTYLNPKTKVEVSRKHFYELVKDDKISPSFLIEKADGTTELKLQVIANLKDILTPKIRVIDGQVTFASFSFDTGLRTGRQIFALALIEENPQSEIFVPYSLLNLQTDKNNQLKKSYPVHCIYTAERGKEDFIHFESEEYKKIKQNKTKRKGTY
ncbi:PBECR4 domain-containing protein [Planococcus ruber]|uniref:PBECR4 domain-containing protein n=1 Tax=Planococcus ruber TaxID=2027871 RepID=UPI001FEE0EED|nr:PBECR4 domain-containing protein [Planococcus ruber]MCJ1908433.1 PBECR4 domain-containing protein [Planococcus ruber]